MKRVFFAASLCILFLCSFTLVAQSDNQSLRNVEKVSDFKQPAEPGNKPDTLVITKPYNPKAILYSIVPEMPLFEGTKNKAETDAAISKFVNNLLDDYGLDLGNIEKCSVIATYVIGSDGIVHDINLMKKCNPEYDFITINIIENFPPFTPGRIKGEPVNVQYILSIKFE